LEVVHARGLQVYGEGACPVYGACTPMSSSLLNTHPQKGCSQSYLCIDIPGIRCLQVSFIQEKFTSRGMWSLMDFHSSYIYKKVTRDSGFWLGCHERPIILFYLRCQTPKFSSGFC